MHYKQIKISVFSKADTYGGGASKVAVDLTWALKKEGISVQHFVGWAGKEGMRDTYPSHVTPLYGRWPERFGIKSFLRAQRILGFPEAIPIELSRLKRSGLLDADLIHVHDITEALSPLSLLWLSRCKPVIWTLHDFSAFTAGCISPFEKEPLGCRRWVDDSGCSKGCPMRASRIYPFGGKANGTPVLWREKQLLARHGHIRLITPSSWLAAEVKKSILYRGRKPDVVSNGIDTIDIFQRRPKTQCKIALGFDPNIRLIVLMAGNLNDLNKGFYWAVQTLEHLPAEIKAGFRILCIGTPPQEAGDQLAGFDVSWAGYVQDQRLLSIMLNASDLMLYPSMADNQPLAVIEALACGTPVFAFRTGGIPEIIPGNSGVVTPRKDCKALAHAISEAIKNDRLSSMSDAARAYAETHLSRERMAASYLELYRLVLRNE